MTDSNQPPSYMPASIAYLPPTPQQGSNEGLSLETPFTLSNPIRVSYSDRGYKAEVRFMLTGASEKLARSFVEQLQEELRNMKFELRPDGFSVWVAKTASKTASRLFPGRDFIIENSTGELQLATTGAVATDAVDVQATVQTALETGAPLEFVYLSAREGAAFQTLRRVNVVKVYRDGLLAKHARGYRRYSFKRLSRVAVGRFAELVGHEPVVIVHHEAWNYGLIALTTATGVDNG